MALRLEHRHTWTPAQFVHFDFVKRRVPHGTASIPRILQLSVRRSRGEAVGWNRSYRDTRVSSKLVSRRLFAEARIHYLFAYVLC